MRKIGLLGGTFDPIHIGHIHLAVFIQEIFSLDEVLFCPASISPFKSHKPALAHHRLNMLKMAIEPISTFQVLEYEIHQENPTYTIDTVHFFYEKFGRENMQLHLILGEDLISGFANWKEPHLLLELAPPLIGTRKIIRELSLEKLPLEIESALEKGKVSIPLLEISSTMIRERIKDKLYTGHLLPQKVSEYIFKHQLYM